MLPEDRLMPWIKPDFMIGGAPRLKARIKGLLDMLQNQVGNWCVDPLMDGKRKPSDALAELEFLRSRLRVVAAEDARKERRISWNQRKLMRRRAL